MIIKIEDLKRILNKISDNKELILSYDDVDGFKIKNANLEIFEKELNALTVNEEYMTVKDIEKHLQISKPTIVKLLKENSIPILDINTFKIKKSDYLVLLSKYYI